MIPPNQTSKIYTKSSRLHKHYDILQPIPKTIIKQLKCSDVSFVMVEDSIVEAIPEMENVRPRGWAVGLTWNIVPGCFDRQERAVVTARSTKHGHGSIDLLLHETGHAVDSAYGFISRREDFIEAYWLDYPTFDEYFTQPGHAGFSEAFAESFAGYYSGDVMFKKNQRNLWKYWNRGIYQ